MSFHFELSLTNYAADPVGALCFPNPSSTCSSLPQTVCLWAPLPWLISCLLPIPYSASVGLLSCGLLTAYYNHVSSVSGHLKAQISMHTCSVFTLQDLRPMSFSYLYNSSL
jgi:hypothetical protein